MIEPSQGTMLLDLERGYTHSRESNYDNVQRRAGHLGIVIPGLDRRFSQIWTRRQVIGVGSVSESEKADAGKVSLDPMLTLS
jgi:hypothetical protein